jgi:hypothetical protein
VSTSHPVTGARLSQPSPQPLRVHAVLDKGDPCTDHSLSLVGDDCRCDLCGTRWNPDGSLREAGQAPGPLPPASHARPPARNRR